MSPRQRLELRRSEIRQRLGELAALVGDALTKTVTVERDGIMAELRASEPQLQAAIAAEAADETRRDDVEGGAITPEERERLELRSRASLGNYLVAAMRGRAPNGAEAELQQAAGVDGIPIELWNVPRPEARQNGGDMETRAVTAAPATVGINLDVLRPMVFAPSIVDKLLVAMPAVKSGTFATGTITTAATADAVAKGADVPETDGGFTVATTTPHRVGASLNLSAEDIAAVGQQNFESILRQHISLALSDKLDDLLLNGAAADNDLSGFFARLTDPAAPAAGLVNFDGFLAQFAGGIDGLWASTMSEVAIVAGVDTYRLSARTFRDRVIDTGQRGGVSLGGTSFADYARQHTAGWWTNKRMPATAVGIQQAILCRKGRSTMPTPTRLAVAPHWGYISVDDIFTGARKGERRYVLSVLVGDLILVQADAYAQVAFRVSA